jgi:hypothetical protein
MYRREHQRARGGQMTDQERAELKRLETAVAEADKDRQESAVRLAQSVLYAKSMGITPAQRWKFIQDDLESFSEDERLYKSALSVFLDEARVIRSGAK